MYFLDLNHWKSFTFIYLANPKGLAIRHLLCLSYMHLNGRVGCASGSSGSVSYTGCTATLYSILNEHNLAIQMNLNGSQNRIWVHCKDIQSKVIEDNASLMN